MKIAFIMQTASTGGVWRFSKALIDGILSADPTAEIGLFANSELAEAERLPAKGWGDRVRVIAMDDPRVHNSPRGEVLAPRPDEAKPWAWRMGRDVLKRWPGVHVAARDAYVGARAALGLSTDWYRFHLPPTAVASIACYDVAYFALPTWVEPTRLPVPVLGTFHDLNYRHFPDNFPADMRRVWHRDFGYWSRASAFTITSTQFIAEDLAAAFPWTREKNRVIYLAPYSHEPLAEERRRELLASLGLSGRTYVVYPANIAPHKNLMRYVEACAIVKERLGAASPAFVITGIGTDAIRGDEGPDYARAVRERCRELNLSFENDLIILGYVTDDEVDAVTFGADAVVSVSLYEAGCGPALDAWAAGVPVAFSNIPPFVEQLDALGVEADVFDPEDPSSIADSIEGLVSDRERAMGMATRSAESMKRSSWTDVGAQYLSVFREAARSTEERATRS